jgi:cephalosporin hydroxylase
MNDEEDFRNRCRNEVNQQGRSTSLQALTKKWVDESIKTNYSYHFEWLGRPIIQYPQDIVGTQQLLWSIKPDLIIETGIARGGSLIFYASMLELIAQCGGPVGAKVLGIDIDIRAHNREAILAHPMSKRIEMIQGSSTNPSLVEEVKLRAKTAKRVMVCLDSNHTHDHVLQELRLYAPLVSVNSYVIVFDTVVENLSKSSIKERPWAKGNNPKTAVLQFLSDLESRQAIGIDNAPLNFQIDSQIENQLLITVAPGGFLKRI